MLKQDQGVRKKDWVKARSGSEDKKKGLKQDQGVESKIENTQDKGVKDLKGARCIKIMRDKNN